MSAAGYVMPSNRMFDILALLSGARALCSDGEAMTKVGEGQQMANDVGRILRQVDAMVRAEHADQDAAFLSTGRAGQGR